jgi:hypothetical protein
MKATPEQIAVVEKMRDGFKQLSTELKFEAEKFDALTAVSEELETLRETVRKLDSAMCMQEKRETGEFHIPAHTAWDIWSSARKLAEPYNPTEENNNG